MSHALNYISLYNSRTVSLRYAHWSARNIPANPGNSVPLLPNRSRIPTKSIGIRSSAGIRGTRAAQTSDDAVFFRGDHALAASYHLFHGRRMERFNRADIYHPHRNLVFSVWAASRAFPPSLRWPVPLSHFLPHHIGFSDLKRFSPRCYCPGRRISTVTPPRHLTGSTAHIPPPNNNSILLFTFCSPYQPSSNSPIVRFICSICRSGIPTPIIFHLHNHRVLPVYRADTGCFPWRFRFRIP